MNRPAREDTKPWYQQFWPWLLISIPAATAIAGFATIWLASREPVALVADDYYKEGLAINRDLAKDQAASQLQLSGELDFNRSADATLARLSGNYVGQELKLAFIHPVEITLDQSIVLQRQADGSYSGPLPVREDRWYLELEGVGNTTEWRLKGEIDLRKGHNVLLQADPS
jgi:hypothetical protein